MVSGRIGKAWGELRIEWKLEISLPYTVYYDLEEESDGVFSFEGNENRLDFLTYKIVDPLHFDNTHDELYGKIRWFLFQQ